MQKLGEYLKKQREDKGIRLEEIASITKIHLQSLQMLEQGNWEELPPEPFIRGFITAYAKYVGVNPADAIERYNHETLKTPETHAEPLKPTVTAEGNPDTVMENAGLKLDWRVGGIAAAFVAVITIGVFIYIGKQTEVEKVPPQASAAPTHLPETTTPPEKTELSTEDLAALVGDTAEDEVPAKESPEVSLPTPSPTPTLAAKPEPTPSAAPPKIVRENASKAAPHMVSVKGGERSYIKIVVDEKAPVEFFLPAGKTVTYEANEKIKVLLGNATGAEVNYNGQKVAGVKYRSGVHAFIYPADSKFPQDTPPPASPPKNQDEDEESQGDSDLDI